MTDPKPPRRQAAPKKAVPKKAPAKRKAPSKTAAKRAQNGKAFTAADAVKASMGTVGRPSSYRPEYAAAMLAFFDVETTREVEYKDREGKIRVKLVLNRFPTIERFADSIGFSTQTLYNWQNAKTETGEARYPEFLDAFVRAREKSVALLIEGTMAGLYEQNFTRFLLVNYSSLREKPADKGDEGTDGPVDRSRLDAIYEAATARALEQKARTQERLRLINEAKNAEEGVTDVSFKDLADDEDDGGVERVIDTPVDPFAADGSP